MTVIAIPGALWNTESMHERKWFASLNARSKLCEKLSSQCGRIAFGQSPLRTPLKRQGCQVSTWYMGCGAYKRYVMNSRPLTNVSASCQTRPHRETYPAKIFGFLVLGIANVRLSGVERVETTRRMSISSCRCLGACETKRHVPPSKIEVRCKSRTSPRLETYLLTLLSSTSSPSPFAF
jgi:hypothetical protein